MSTYNGAFMEPAWTVYVPEGDADTISINFVTLEEASACAQQLQKMFPSAEVSIYERSVMPTGFAWFHASGLPYPW